MQTDIPLKRLTALRVADLLPLLGGRPTAGGRDTRTAGQRYPAGQRPAPAQPQGQEYLHVIEWQGYHDLAVLWRLTGYQAWLGQRDPTRVVIGTLIYLKPEDDVGDTLQQIIDGQVVSAWRLPVVRLWELEAAEAVQPGAPGLAVLSPLMHGASVALVEQAADLVLRQAPLPQQPDLLSILGVFAEPLIAPERFARLVGKERLMASDLLTYLMDEKLAEVEKQHAAELAAKDAALMAAELAAKDAALVAELAAKDVALRQAPQDAAEDAVVLRFPNIPAILVCTIRRLTDPEQLKALHTRALQAPDQATVERLLAELAPGDE
jgi:hypothetical protein